MGGVAGFLLEFGLFYNLDYLTLFVFYFIFQTSVNNTQGLLIFFMKLFCNTFQAKKIRKLLNLVFKLVPVGFDIHFEICPLLFSKPTGEIFLLSFSIVSLIEVSF